MTSALTTFRQKFRRGECPSARDLEALALENGKSAAAARALALEHPEFAKAFAELRAESAEEGDARSAADRFLASLKAFRLP